MSTVLSTPQQLPAVPTQQDRGPDWKRQLAERLDAYRAKHPETISLPSSSNTFADSRASRIARSVASRYAAAPTYSELLLAAAEAERAAAEAQAALAEREARDARVAQEKAIQEQMAQEQIVECQSDADLANRELLQSSPMDAERAFAERYGSPIRTQPATPVMPQFAARTREMHLHQAAPEPEPTLEDLWASSLVEPRSLLPSKLIEFPRELVSSHRARPRLPEDPALETTPAVQQPEPAQLRIFEVQPETEQPNPAEVAVEALADNPESTSESKQLLSDSAPSEESDSAPQNLFQNPIQDSSQRSTAAVPEKTNPAVANRVGVVTPVRLATSSPRSPVSPSGRDSGASTARAFKGLEWAAISLDKEPAMAPRRRETTVADYVPFLVDPASIDRRLMAFAVDFAAVTAGFLAFLLVFVASTPHLPSGLPAIVLAGAVYISLWVLYQMLFFSLSGATAGMLYARIALCTFDDQNPTRPALRRRLAAWWLSCLPLGIGFLWCFVDEDNLSWHDRMTGMYQRGY